MISRFERSVRAGCSSGKLFLRYTTDSASSSIAVTFFTTVKQILGKYAGTRAYFKNLLVALQSERIAYVACYIFIFLENAGPSVLPEYPFFVFSANFWTKTLVFLHKANLFP